MQCQQGAHAVPKERGGRDAKKTDQPPHAALDSDVWVAPVHCRVARAWLRVLHYYEVHVCRQMVSPRSIEFGTTASVREHHQLMSHRH